MKKIFKLSMVTLVALLALFTLASCGGVSQKWADKINDKAETDEPYTYDELIKKLGDPTIDISGSLSIGGLEIKPSGVVTWANGCDDKDDYEAALKDGKTVETLVVTFVNGNATGAVYKEVSND